MHPSKVIKHPIINDTYYDPDVDKLYQYVKIGDFPPESVVTNIDEEDDYYYASIGYEITWPSLKVNKFASLICLCEEN